ncbi:hypothetical protein, partial [Pseudomonas koreensis]|uniref:hypothetical protein n=1 Tax=Pseudomonas koreensis TaxID=198620 RepID=UPI001F2C164E
RLPFWRLKKVTRRKGGTLSSRYRSNGYVLTQKDPHRLKKLRGQAPQGSFGQAKIFATINTPCRSEPARDGGGSSGITGD